jgi:hypothetical protein
MRAFFVGRSSGSGREEEERFPVIDDDLGIIDELELLLLVSGRREELLLELRLNEKLGFRGAGEGERELLELLLALLLLVWLLVWLLGGNGELELELELLLLSPRIGGGTKTGEKSSSSVKSMIPSSAAGANF